MSHVAASPVTSSSVSSKNAPWAVFKRAIPGVLAWLIALLLFFPIFWMSITAFKTEQQAYASSLFFIPTLDSFREVFARSNYFSFASNSVLISAGVTVVCLLLAVPCAYAMAFFPTRRTQSLLLWMLSTKMMPSVGVLVPIYLLWKNTGLLDSVSGLIIIYTLINLQLRCG
jgi:sorbitol/mannitol transport system permease protein